MINTYLDKLVESAEILHGVKVKYFLSREYDIGQKVEFIAVKGKIKYYGSLIITDEYRKTAPEFIIVEHMKETLLKVVMPLV